MVTHGHFLDGREFSGTLRIEGHFPEQNEIIRFRDGKIQSPHLASLGFPLIEYEVLMEKEASEATRLALAFKTKNKIAEELRVDGVVEGNDVYINFEIHRPGKPAEHVHFSGAAPAVFRNDYWSLGV